MEGYRILLLFSLVSIIAAQESCKSNIVMFITDDQDYVLDAMEPMAKTREWFAPGQMFENAFVSTPVCCPSRASLLTGRYQHNTHVVNNSEAGNCYGPEWTNGLEATATFGSIIQQEGNYNTFYAGKYLNRYKGKSVPAGWDYWAGLQGNSKYYNYELNINGQLVKHGDDYEKDYLTDEIGRQAMGFLANHTAHDCDKPFLMVLATPSPHAPFTPAPQHANAFSDRVAPRRPDFNHVEDESEAKHWLVRTPPRPLNQTLIDRVDDQFRQRWRTLLSVDELVDDVLNFMSDHSLLEKSYVIFTSDHGYHLGNYGLPYGKRMPYDTGTYICYNSIVLKFTLFEKKNSLFYCADIRVPLMIRGPGIASKNQQGPAVITLDMAPTLIDMAGLNYLDYGMDGISLLPMLKGQDESEYSEREFLVEYHGEGGNGNAPACQVLVNFKIVCSIVRIIQFVIILLLCIWMPTFLSLSLCVQSFA